MSIRTLIEINHDFAGRQAGLADALHRYLCSGSEQHAKALEAFGLKVLGLRHHSGRFYADREPDGFPLKVLHPTPQPHDEPAASHRSRETLKNPPPKAVGK